MMPDMEEAISSVEEAIEIVENEAYRTVANGLRYALALLKEQDKRIKELELEKGWDESPDMMGKW